MAPGLEKPFLPPWTRAVGLWLAVAAWSQATVGELPGNRCGLNMAGLVTQIRVGSGGGHLRAASPPDSAGPAGLRAHFGRLLELLSLGMNEIRG